MPRDDFDEENGRRERYERERGRGEDEYSNRRKRSRSPRRVDVFGRDTREREKFYGKERDSYYERDSRKSFRSDYNHGRYDTGYSNSSNYGYSTFSQSYSQQYPPNQYQTQYGGYGTQYQESFSYQPSFERPNPLLGDQFLAFKQFKDLHDPNISPQDLNQKYEDYKLEFKARQMAKFYSQHKTEEWFVERYHPSFKEQRESEELRIALEKQSQYLEDLRQGKYDSIELEEASDATIDLNQSFQMDEEEDKEKDDKESKINEADSKVLLIKSIPPSVKKTQVLEICQKLSGFVRLEMGEPNPAKRFHRLAWVTFSESTNVQEVCKGLENTKVDSFQLHFVIYKQKLSRKVSVPAVTMTERRLRKDLSQSYKLVTIFNNQKKLNSIIPVPEEIENTPITDVKKILDKLILYLRKVHFFDYYMGIQFETEDALLRRFPNPPLRNNKPGVTTNDEPWEKYLDSKIEAKISSILTPEQEAKLGKKDINNNSEIDYYMDSNTIRIDEAKFRCKLCEKLFKGAEFVRKHIATKHQDNLVAIKEEVTLFNNFISDYNTIYPLVHQSMLVDVNALPEKSKTKFMTNNEARFSAGYAKTWIYKDPRQVRSYSDFEDPKEFDELLEYRLEGVDE